MARGRIAHFGSSVYPSPSAKKRRRLGRTPFLYCRQCGTPNDTRKTAHGEGDGIVYDSASPPDHTVESGCRFCGSMSWTKNKPHALPDGDNLPFKGWRRKRR